MKKILITGCNGLIGEELMSQLKNNFTLFGLSRSVTKQENILQIDLSTDWNYNELPTEIDIVIHLAQSEKFRDFPSSSVEVFNVNTNSTLKLLEYARLAKAKKFIYASSGGVYGNSDSGFNEESPLQPNKDLGFYLTTKYCSEMLVENYASFFDINILRFFFVYGVKQKKAMLVPRLIESIKSGKEITLQGEDGIRINPIFVEDAVRAIHGVCNKPGSYNLNIGGKETLSIKELCDAIAKQLGIEAKYIKEDKEAKHLIADISKMKNLLGEPKITFAEGIKKMVQ